MRLELHAAALQVGAERHLSPIDLAPTPGAMTVLLGATLAGKTSLMRLMAGLERPSSGRVVVDGRDVTGVPVRERKVAMVYQQFINYPSMTVFDNIASPLRLSRTPGIEARVRELAQRLHIDHLLERLPAQLSGGQQQRVALARALVKNAPLVLLDEPLVNLDYKLREELRDELGQLFASGLSTVVYATTEPSEALLLGGWTAVLDQGRLLQYGPTPEVFHRPASLEVARAFSDPPMNLVAARASDGGVALPGGFSLALPLPGVVPGSPITVGVRAGHLAVSGADGDLCVPATVELAEISGSDSYVHASSPLGPLVAQLAGVHRFALGDRLALRVSAERCHVFGDDGRLLRAPAPGAT
jgi:glycerol transport system ATP-binding protein